MANNKDVSPEGKRNYYVEETTPQYFMRKFLPQLLQVCCLSTSTQINNNANKSRDHENHSRNFR